MSEPVKKKAAPRKKKAEPSPLELKNMLLKEKDEMEKELGELKMEYESRVKPLGLKHTSEILEDEIAGLCDELEEITEQLKELENPQPTSS
jgi:hypothetical protein